MLKSDLPVIFRHTFLFDPIRITRPNFRRLCNLATLKTKYSRSVFLIAAEVWRIPPPVHNSLSQQARALQINKRIILYSRFRWRKKTSFSGLAPHGLINYKNIKAFVSVPFQDSMESVRYNSGWIVFCELYFLTFPILCTYSKAFIMHPNTFPLCYQSLKSQGLLKIIVFTDSVSQ